MTEHHPSGKTLVYDEKTGEMRLDEDKPAPEAPDLSILLPGWFEAFAGALSERVGAYRVSREPTWLWAAYARDDIEAPACPARDAESHAYLLGKVEAVTVWQRADAAVLHKALRSAGREARTVAGCVVPAKVLVDCLDPLVRRGLRVVDVASPVDTRLALRWEGGALVVRSPGQCSQAPVLRLHPAPTGARLPAFLPLATDVREVLLRVRQRIADPARWSVFHGAEAEDGRAVACRDPRARRWRLGEAIWRETPPWPCGKEGCPARILYSEDLEKCCAACRASADLDRRARAFLRPHVARLDPADTDRAGWLARFEIHAGHAGCLALLDGVLAPSKGAP